MCIFSEATLFTHEKTGKQGHSKVKSGEQSHHYYFAVIMLGQQCCFVEKGMAKN